MGATDRSVCFASVLARETTKSGPGPGVGLRNRLRDRVGQGKPRSQDGEAPVRAPRARGLGLRRHGPDQGGGGPRRRQHGGRQEGGGGRAQVGLVDGVGGKRRGGASGFFVFLRACFVSLIDVDGCNNEGSCCDELVIVGVVVSSPGVIIRWRLV